MEPYLSIQNVSVSYGATRVLDRVSLDVERGQMIALLGSSGCGKTTLLRSIAGFVIPDAGAILVEGRDITRLPPEKRATAMMFQSYALWPHMSVAANIGYGLRMRHWKAADIGKRVDEMLKMLQLDGFGPRPVTQLSGGSASAWHSGAHLRSTRRSCCSTSPCPTSITKYVLSCGTNCARCSGASVSPPFTSRTTARRRSRLPIALP